MQFDDRFYQNLLENLDEGVYYVDHNRKILFWNKAAERISGYTKSEVEEHNCFDNILDHVDCDGHHLCQTNCPLSHTLLDGKNREEMMFLHHKDGHRVPVHARVIPIKNPEGLTLGAVEIFTEKPVESNEPDNPDKYKELVKLAYIDQATHLPNQNYLTMKWASLHREMDEIGSFYGIIALRISNYGAIVENYGPSVAIRMLKTVTKTLTGITPTVYAIGRWEEAVLLSIIQNANPKMIDTFEKRYCRMAELSVFSQGNRSVGVRTKVKTLLSHQSESLPSAMTRFSESSYRRIEF